MPVSATDQLGNVSKNSRNLLIAGGGIAGLTAALFLADAGFRIEVFERSEGVEHTGAGIQLSPNALYVLNQLNLLNQVKSVATAPLAVNMYAAFTGEMLNSMPLGTSVLDRYELPYLVLHRADFCQILTKACEEHPDINLHLGSEVIDAVPHANGITAMVFRHDTIEEFIGKALIAADGISSKFRTEYLEEQPAKYSGHVAWRGLIPAEHLDRSRLDNVEVWFSPDTHGVCYPVRNNRYLNVVLTCEEPDPREKILLKGPLPILQEETKNWDQKFTSMLNHNTRWTRWPIYEVNPAKNWCVDRLVLIGDSAHAMSPHAAQGAAMAVEDAFILSQCLAELEDVDRALLKYTKLRKPRISRAAKMAKKNQKIFQMGTPISHVRDFVLRSMPQNSLLKRQDWLYRWRG